MNQHLLVLAALSCGRGAAQHLVQPLLEDAHYFNHLDPLRGSYHFGYDTGVSQHQSFREEARASDGSVRGRFGYVESGSGVLRITEYVADRLGYRSRETVRFLVAPLATSPSPSRQASYFPPVPGRVRGGPAPAPARVMGKKVVGRYKDFTVEPAVGGTAAISRWDSAHGPAAELREEELPAILQNVHF